MDLVWIALIFILGGFVQGAAGFGLPIVVVPALIGLIGVRASSATVALVATALVPIFLIRYRRSLNIRVMVPLIVWAYVGIPIGAFMLRQVDSDIIVRALGVFFLLLYALYAWFTPKLPELTHRAWAYLFGFVSGILAGAYTIGGAAIVIYASCKRWPLDEFKGNLQAFFLIINIFVIANHAIAGNLTDAVWRTAALALPVALLGLFAGFAMDRHLRGPRFQRIVLLLLMGISLRLIFA